MPGRETHQREEIDRKTSRSICEAVGERLQESLKPHSMERAPELERLVEKLRRREREGGANRPRGSRGFRFFW
jgi:hypothetical protein